MANKPDKLREAFEKIAVEKRWPLPTMTAYGGGWIYGHEITRAAWDGYQAALSHEREHGNTPIDITENFMMGELQAERAKHHHVHIFDEGLLCAYRFLRPYLTEREYSNFIKELVDVIHQPSPKNPKMWCVKPKRGLEFSRIIQALYEIEAEAHETRKGE